MSNETPRTCKHNNSIEVGEAIYATASWSNCPWCHIDILERDLAAAKRALELERETRLQLANDSQSHLDRALDAEQRALTAEKDAEMLERRIRQMIGSQSDY